MLRKLPQDEIEIFGRSPKQFIKKCYQQKFNTIFSLYEIKHEKNNIFEQWAQENEEKCFLTKKKISYIFKNNKSLYKNSLFRIIMEWRKNYFIE